MLKCCVASFHFFDEAFAGEGPALLSLPIDYEENLKLTERLGQIECAI